MESYYEATLVKHLNMYNNNNNNPTMTVTSKGSLDQGSASMVHGSTKLLRLFGN